VKTEAKGRENKAKRSDNGNLKKETKSKKGNREKKERDPRATLASIRNLLYETVYVQDCTLKLLPARILYKRFHVARCYTKAETGFWFAYLRTTGGLRALHAGSEESITIAETPRNMIYFRFLFHYLRHLCVEVVVLNSEPAVEVKPIHRHLHN
jgi:hypothetical protein